MTQTNPSAQKNHQVSGQTYTVQGDHTGPQVQGTESEPGGCQGRGSDEMGGEGRAEGASSCLQPYLTLGLTLRTDMRRK